MNSIIFIIVSVIIFAGGGYILKREYDVRYIEEELNLEKKNNQILAEENLELKYYASIHEQALKILAETKEKEKIIERFYDKKIVLQEKIVNEAESNSNLDYAFHDFDSIFELSDVRN